MPTLAVNKRARFDYDLKEEFEGGLVLTGAEVKAAKNGSIHMKGAFMSVQDGELWVKNLHIGRYAPAGKQEEYDPTRSRKVLVRTPELNQLIGKSQQNGLTIVPIRVYTKGAFVKIAFALARGKKKYEKREAVKKRDVQKQIREQMKRSF